MCLLPRFVETCTTVYRIESRKKDPKDTRNALLFRPDRETVELLVVVLPVSTPPR
jgi:hypothetical protein